MPAFYSVVFGLVLWVIGASLFLGAFLLWVYSEKRAYDEPRRILCPENRSEASVVVDSEHAARSMLAGHQEFRIVDCSRWPERQGCDQACSVQVALLGDDRTKGEYAPFGSTPQQLRIHNPVRMTLRMLERISGK